MKKKFRILRADVSIIAVILLILGIVFGIYTDLSLIWDIVPGFDRWFRWFALVFIVVNPLLLALILPPIYYKIIYRKDFEDKEFEEEIQDEIEDTIIYSTILYIMGYLGGIFSPLTLLLMIILSLFLLFLRIIPYKTVPAVKRFIKKKSIKGSIESRRKEFFLVFLLFLVFFLLFTADKLGFFNL